MVREATHKKKTIFTVEKDGREQVAPTWREAEFVNAECPICYQLITVIIPGGERQFIYAHCSRCQKGFIGD